jgi:hypothetical protein
VTATLSKNAEKGKTSASDQFLRNKFRTFKQGKQERTKQNLLVSGQRYNFVRCVYSMADLELSTCILCLRISPLSTPPTSVRPSAGQYFDAARLPPPSGKTRQMWLASSKRKTGTGC